jgi:ATP-independent RNA helicase DbpA
MQEAVRIQAAGEAAHADIRSEFFQVREAEKAMALIQVLRERRPQAAVVFCNTRKACDAVQQQLDAAGFSALALHGDYEQRDRDEVLIRFANESANVLVATDVAARGLDVSHVDLVINYDVPFEPEVHIHRVGRTGRAGKQGNAITLVGDTDGNRLSAIAALLGTPIEPKTLRSMRLSNAEKLFAPMRTLRIDGGKSDKLRPGDILGTLTGEGGLKAEAIGKIAIRATRSYVAIRRGQAQAALNYLRNGKIKGRKFRAASLD